MAWSKVKMNVMMVRESHGQRSRSNECHDGTRQSPSNLDVPTYQISPTRHERQTSYGPDNFFPLFDLGVKGQGQMNVMMVHNTPSNGDAPTYQISLPYLERQTRYGPDKILPLFDLEVKGQGQMNVMMVRDTPSYDDVPKYKISPTYLERQTSYGPN